MDRYRWTTGLHPINCQILVVASIVTQKNRDHPDYRFTASNARASYDVSQAAIRNDLTSASTSDGETRSSRLLRRSDQDSCLVAESGSA